MGTARGTKPKREEKGAREGRVGRWERRGGTMGQPRGLWHLSPQRGGYHPNSQDQGQGPPGNAEANQREMAAGKGGDYGREGEAHGWGKRGREVKGGKRGRQVERGQVEGRKRWRILERGRAEGRRMVGREKRWEVRKEER